MEQWCGLIGAFLLMASLLTGNGFLFFVAVALLIIWWMNKGPGGP